MTNQIETKRNQDLASDIINRRIQESDSTIEKQILVGHIVSQSENDFRNFLEKQKQEKLVTEKEFQKQELDYKNSIYYKSYLNMLQTIDNIVATIYNGLLIKYNNNIAIYTYPFGEKVVNSVLIRGIGFPIPDSFLNQIVDIVKNKLYEISKISDVEFEVDIIPFEYLQVGRLYKHADSYILNVEVKRKQKVKTLI